MKLTRKRGIGLGIGITIFLVAFSIALAVTWIQVSQTVPSTLSVSSTVIISGDNISLWWDTAMTQPVTGDPALEWAKAQTQPPLRNVNITTDVWFYIVNESPYGLVPVDPCHNIIRSTDNQRIGWTHTQLRNLNGDWRGDACDVTDWRMREGFVMAPGEMWQMQPHPHFDNLAIGDHPFDLIVGAIGNTGDAAAALSNTAAGTFSAPADHHPRPPSR